VVYGQEYYFGGMGIEGCNPGGTVLKEPLERLSLGKTEVPFELFLEYITALGEDKFKPENYQLFENNCNSFSSEVAKFLTGNDIPSYITGLPASVLSTPMGQMIKTWMDGVTISPGLNNQNNR